MPPLPKPPEHPIARELVFTAKAIREAFERVLEDAGGSLGTWIVLSALTHDGPFSQRDLAGHAQLEGATITHHVDRLERAGLVRRVVDPVDRRVRRIEATAAGKELRARLVEAAIGFEQELLTDIAPAEIAALRGVLARLSANLPQR